MYLRKTLLMWMGLALLGAMSYPAAAEEGEASEPVVNLSVKEGLFNLEAKHATLGDVLKALAAQTGVEVDLDGALLNQPVEVELDRVTFEQLMDKLTGSHALVYERAEDGSYRLTSAQVTSQQEWEPEKLGFGERRQLARAKKEVGKVLTSSRELYGYAGVLDYDEAKALIQKRKAESALLVDQLVALGPGGARAIREVYGDLEGKVTDGRDKVLMISALEKIDDPEAAAQLASMYGDESDAYALRREIVGALGERADSEAQLLNLLATDDDIRIQAVVARVLSRKPGAVGALSGLVNSISMAEDVRQEAVRSLGLIGSEEARSAIDGVALSPMSTAMRETAIQELGRSYPNQSIPTFATLLKDRSEGIRWNTVKAISRVGTPEARALLEQAATEDGLDKVRANAQAYLDRFASTPSAADSVATVE